MQYISTEQRMLAAKQLLSVQKLSVNVVCEKVGYTESVLLQPALQGVLWLCSVQFRPSIAAVRNAVSDCLKHCFQVEKTDALPFYKMDKRQGVLDF